MSLSKPVPIILTMLLMGVVGFGLWQFGGLGASGPTPAGPSGTALPPAAPASREDSLSSAFGFLQEKPGPEGARRSLAELRASLLSLPKDEAVAQIRGFLEKGEDRNTGLSFEIGRDGSLSEWPTFRTFLLDVLAAVDPEAAAAVGRDILATPTTADEWALALRNVARGETAADPEFLRAKAEEMITNPVWQADPSIGYLNAFDVLVHVQATASSPLLSSLIQKKDRKDLAHAGFLTLDRLVQSQPVEMFTRLAADTTLQQRRPEMVAQQFARADLRDPAQQAIIKSWLLDPARTDAELRSFAGVYPNNNQFVSNNLLTAQKTAPGGDLASHDREALKIVSAWAADPGFASVQQHLNAMVTRLDGFVGSRDQDFSSPPPE